MKKIIGVLLGVVTLALGGSAHALDLGVGGGIGVQATTSSMDVGVGTGVAAQSATSARSQNSGNMNGSANIDSSVGLQAQIQTVIANTSSIDAVVRLQGNTAALIKSDADLSAYNDLIIKDRPVITAINIHSDNSIAVNYSQSAKLFDIFPASLSGEVDVDAQGNTTVHLPWYAIFYAKNTANIQTSVVAAIQQSGASFGAQASGEAQVQNQARIISAATAALQVQTQNHE